MTDEPAVYHGDGRAVFLSVWSYVVAAVVAALGFVIGSAIMRIVLLGESTAPIGSVFGAVGGGIMLAWLYVRARAVSYELSTDEIARVNDRSGARASVAPGEVAFVLRRQSRRSALLGVASYEFVSAEGVALSASFLTDPDGFERELRDLLPSPAAWLDDPAHDRDERTALHATVRALATEQGAGDAESVASGESTILTEAELADVLDVDASTVDVGGLAAIDGVDGVADLDADDVMLVDGDETEES